MSISRRDFCSKSLTIISAAGITSVLPLHTACNIFGDSANNKLVVGLIGCKGMGFNNLTTFLNQKNVECAGLCDIDKSILEQRAANVDKILTEKEKEDEIKYKRPKLYSDFRKLLENKDIDAVIIGTPDHWHAMIMILACEAGKDVYVEKPMANSIAEANLMVRAARHYKKVIQVGQWQRSGPHWEDTKNFVRSGKLGKISKVEVWRYGGNEVPLVPDSQVPDGVDYNMWLGPARNRAFNKNRFHYNFRWFWDYAGGKMTDWGVHLLDMAFYSMDSWLPNSVSAEGGKFVFPNDAMETPDTLTANYEFDDFKIVWKNNFGLKTDKTGRDHGLAFSGEKGILYASRTGWEVIPKTKNGIELMEKVPFSPSVGNHLDLHVKNFIQCVKSREKTACDVETGRDVAINAHLGNIAYRTGNNIVWNPENNSFGNDQAANALILPDYRSPWILPII
ncbi:Gfo/Idh/MocA family protein [Bacteroidota bacterium]